MSPAGPLDGAARIRPDGWLRAPLTTDLDQAEAQARQLVYVHHPQALGPLRCLTARYRTAAFALGTPPTRLLKRHADEAAYLGETLAYQILADEDVLPVLHGHSDATRTLVVDYLDQGADLTVPHMFDELVRLVATIHTASARWHPVVAEAMSPWRVEALRNAPPPQWITRHDPWRRLMDLVSAAHGPEHVPLGHLDLKSDHVRRGADGRLLLIDVETLRPDLTGLPDLITLVHLAGDAIPDLPPSWVRRGYLRHINSLGARWTDTALRSALVAFADATGLHSLHGAET